MNGPDRDVGTPRWQSRFTKTGAVTVEPMVDVRTARDDAAADKKDVLASQQALRDVNIAIAAAQQRIDRFAAA